MKIFNFYRSIPPVLAGKPVNPQWREKGKIE